MITQLGKLSRLYSRKSKILFLGVFGMTIIGTLLEMASVGSIPLFLYLIESPEFLIKAPIIGPFFASFNIADQNLFLIWSSLILLVVFLLKNGYLILLRYIQSRFVLQRQLELGKRVFSSYLKAPYSFALQNNSSELIRNSSLEVRLIGAGVLTPLLNVMLNAAILIGISSLLLIFEPLVTLAIITVLGLSSYLFLKQTRNSIQKMGQLEQKHRSLELQSVKEGIEGLKEIKILGKESLFLDNFYYSASRNAQAQQRRMIVEKITAPVMESFSVIGMVLIIISLILLDRDLNAFLPTLGLFGIGILKLQGAASGLVSSFTQIKYNIVSVEPVYRDLKKLEDLEYASFQHQKPHTSVALQNTISIENVCFSYPGEEKEVLSNINLEINQGEVVGIVGPTGSGKTTLVDLILGLLEPKEGFIKADGADIHTSIKSWQSQLGYIPQDIFLIDGSIRENIALGVENDQIDRSKMSEVVATAQLKPLIQELANGLDTKAGERGVRLSGGQKQRVSIARALYSNPAILIMDEATSALDNKTESLLIKAIDRARSGRTVIMIAHRLTSIKKCDRIFFLKNGMLRATGTYQELLKTSEDFRNMIEES